MLACATDKSFAEADLLLAKTYDTLKAWSVAGQFPRRNRFRQGGSGRELNSELMDPVEG